MSCIVSVERTEGGYGKIRIVTGNRPYIDSIEKPQPGVEMLTTEFVPNSEYTRYLTQDLNFENYCYLSAVKKQTLHTYVNPDRIPVWFDLTFLPLDADDDKLSYCLYTMEVNLQPDSERLSTVSEALALKAFETAVKLSSAGDFKSVMGDVIADIRELCDAEHCCILLADDVQHSCTVLCEAFADGSDLISMESLIDEHSFDITQSWNEIIAGSNCFIVANDHDREVVKHRSPEWYAELEAANTDSILLFPLKSANKTLGYIWAMNFNPSDAIKIKETLQAVSFVLAAQIANHLMLNQLKILSSHDMLTGVQNSNEFILVTEAMADEERAESVGVIVADLNGLKRVNDSQGHFAGDALIKHAAQTLLEVFEPQQVFRAGGDEFAVIITDATEDEVAQKVASLRKIVENHDAVTFAIGYCVVENTAHVREALRVADARMYDDKRAYYEQSSNDRRARFTR